MQNMEKQQTEDITQYLKLTRNSKGYTWDIKINSLAIDKLKEINTKLLEEFGVQND
jgi:hypothetical protein